MKKYNKTYGRKLCEACELIEFTKISPTHRFCSKECYLASIRQSRRKWGKKCIVCETEITNNNIKFCSDTCRNNHNNIN